MPENHEDPSLKELGEKIQKAKKETLENQDANSVAAPGAMRVGVDLLAGVLAGSFVGYYLDKWLGTLPVFFIICFFLGVGGAIRNIMREIKRSDQPGNKD